MLYPNSILKIADNSGARFVKCLQVSGSSKKKFYKLGETVRVAVQEFKVTRIRKKKLVRNRLYNAIIISTSKKNSRITGFSYKFESNRALIFNQNKQFMGTRVYGCSLKEVKLNPHISKIAILVQTFF